jgi:hypothetical protein
MNMSQQEIEVQARIMTVACLRSGIEKSLVILAVQRFMAGNGYGYPYGMPSYDEENIVATATDIVNTLCEALAE